MEDLEFRLAPTYYLKCIVFNDNNKLWHANINKEIEIIKYDQMEILRLKWLFTHIWEHNEINSWMYIRNNGGQKTLAWYIQNAKRKKKVNQEFYMQHFILQTENNI